jgi:hypothetical protein
MLLALPQPARRLLCRIVPIFGNLANRMRRRATPVKAKQTLRIVYEPKHDGHADPGEVVWTWVPYEEDAEQGKDRPALVIGFFGPALAVLPLTSKDHTDHPDCVELGRGAWDLSGRTSYVKLDRLLRVPPTKVRREGAALDRDRFDFVVQSFKAYTAASHR